MMTRYRWYRIKLPRGSKSISDIFSDYPFIKNSIFGFSKVAEDYSGSAFRFLFRSKVLFVRYDDIGNPIYEEIDTVDALKFSIIYREKCTFLRLENPGRSLKDFFNSLEDIIGLGFSASLVTFEKKWPTSVLECVDVSNQVGLKISQASVGKGVLAKMEFFSFEGFSIDSIRILNKFNYTIESATYDVIYKGIKGGMVFSSNGNVKLSGKLSPMLIDLIERDLPNISNWKDQLSK